MVERGHPGETYNIGSRNERTNPYVVEKICALLDELAPFDRGSYHDLISFVDDRPGHDRRYAIDPSKLENELGWQAEETFETGLAKTVQWFVQNRIWWRQILDRGYRTERIGTMPRVV